MKDIKGYEGLYAITTCGKVWSYRKQKFLAPADNGHGYMIVILFDASGNREHHRIHRLVAETYIPNPEDKPLVNHKDVNRKNNCLNNLEWVTEKENCNYEKNNSSYARPRTRILCIETGDIYKNQREAANVIGITPQAISHCITGKQKTAGGYHWTRISEN